jgi:demethoxyubiquinone hydroxylase (CLK1/Coq7/Cat5 family)
LIAPDLARTDALARFHVRLPDGTLESGARGFGAVWTVVPGFRWLGTIARSHAAQPMLEAAYRGFLKVRPMAQRVAAKAESPVARAYPRWLERELRSNHAGEAGAVAIYRGILAVSRCSEVRRFAARHLKTESRHLAVLGELLPAGQRSRLLPIWIAAGFLAGALPAIFGRRAIYATIEAVETFVDSHYRQQVDRLDGDGCWVQVREILESCRQDELSHRDEARQLGDGGRGMALRVWLRAIAIGSAAGVALARRV